MSGAAQPAPPRSPSVPVIVVHAEDRDLLGHTACTLEEMPAEPAPEFAEVPRHACTGCGLMRGATVEVSG